MKLLLIGDFGGQVPEPIVQAIKQEEFDAVIATGDYADVKQARNIFLSGGRTQEAQNQMDEVFKQAFPSVIPVLDFLAKTVKPVYAVIGNSEFNFIKEQTINYAKNVGLHILEDESTNFQGIRIVGMTTLPFSQDNVHARKPQITALISRPKDTILVSHVPPHGCAIDKLPEDNPRNPGKHVGRQMEREIVDEKQPALHICGHLGETWGEDTIGKTRVINPGAVEDNRYAILTITDSLANATVEFKQA